MMFFSFRESPPYYAYGLACLQFLIGGLYWTAAQKYANKVAPPSLVGTMTGIVGSVNWIIAKGDTKMLHKPFFQTTKSEKVKIMNNLIKSLSVFISFQYIRDLSKRLKYGFCKKSLRKNETMTI